MDIRERGRCHIARKKLKGQASMVDIFLGLTLFLVAFGILMKSHVNLNATKDFASEMTIEGEFISDILFSEGVPNDWDASNVTQPGLLTNGRISHRKLEELEDLDYATSKHLLSTRYDYFITVSSYDGNKLETHHFDGRDGIGMSGINSTNLIDVEDPKNVLKVTRVGVYNHSIARVVIVLWE